MDVADALNSRFTCRAFMKKPVPKEYILKILKDATRSPSWANTQPWEIFVATGEVLERIRKEYMDLYSKDVPTAPEIPWVNKWPSEHAERMKELGNMRFKHLKISGDDKTARNANYMLNFKFFGAPVVVYICMNKSLTEWSVFDLGLFSQSLMLAARDYGIDSAPAVNLVAYPDTVKRELEIPEELTLVFGIALGYKDEESPQNTIRTQRRPLDEVVRLYGFE